MEAGKLGTDPDSGADVGEAAAGVDVGAHGFIDAEAADMDGDREDGSVVLQSAPIGAAADSGNAFASAFQLSVAQAPVVPEAGVRKSAALGTASCGGAAPAAVGFDPAAAADDVGDSAGLQHPVYLHDDHEEEGPIDVFGMGGGYDEVNQDETQEHAPSAPRKSALAAMFKRKS